MKQTTVRITLAYLVAVAAASPAFCQVPSGEKSAAHASSNAASAEVQVISDRSHPVRKALQAQYARLAVAIKKKDIDALFALYTPDFHAVIPTGEVWNRERALAYQRNGLALVKETTHISNTIVRLVLRGENEATATVLQVWYRTQTMAGKLRRVETQAVQDEEWTRMPDGWKRGNILDVQNGVAFVDGKRVDTNKPYDPEAPAYDPDDPNPRQPVADALFVAITEKGLEAALKEYPSLLRQSQTYYQSEASMNALGYRLLGMKKTAEAIAIFKRNAETYPRSANVYDSLAEAYLAGGDREQAIRNYRKSLALNPQNANARDQLKKLEEAGEKPRS